jgi:DNA-directed RNA polymerase alpha subunit
MGEVLCMTRTELLDHFAIHAMQAQIEKTGISNCALLAHSAYQMAIEMLRHRERIFHDWQKEQEIEQKKHNPDIQELNLPIRYQRCLLSENIFMKQDLYDWTERDIRRIPNLGVKGLQFVKEAMALHGLKFKGQE